MTTLCRHRVRGLGFQKCLKYPEMISAATLSAASHCSWTQINRLSLDKLFKHFKLKDLLKNARKK